MCSFPAVILISPDRSTSLMPTFIDSPPADPPPEIPLIPSWVCKRITPLEKPELRCPPPPEVIATSPPLCFAESEVPAFRFKIPPWPDIDLPARSSICPANVRAFPLKIDTFPDFDLSELPEASVSTPLLPDSVSEEIGAEDTSTAPDSTADRAAEPESMEMLPPIDLSLIPPYNSNEPPSPASELPVDKIISPATPLSPRLEPLESLIVLASSESPPATLIFPLVSSEVPERIRISPLLPSIALGV